jgi:hypothetical protein
MSSGRKDVTARRIGLAALATGLAAGLAIDACTPAPPPPPPAPAISYDGTYQGAVVLKDIAAGVASVGCAPNPHLVLQVKNNAFTYVQPHKSDLLSTTPGTGKGVASAIYTVAIAQNGSFGGQSQEAGTIAGVISGTHMTGTIEGLECVYSFTADRS